MRLSHLWSIQTPSVIHVDAPPEICLSLLSKAAQPSIDRLHLGEAFAEGRRYFIEATTSGFHMTTTSKTLIRRQRTEALTILQAQVIGVNEHSTSIVLHGRIRPIRFLFALWIPAGMIWLLWPVPWPRLFIIGILTGILGFAWAGVRYGAALEIIEMIYFIHKAFENVPKFTPAALPASTGNHISGTDFDVLWDQFVRAHQHEI